jgi:hypothetical protein
MKKKNRKRRSEMTPEQLARIRAADAVKARRRRALRGGAINEQRRKAYQENKKRVLEKNKNWRRRNMQKVYARRRATGETRKQANLWYHRRGKFNQQHVLRELLRGRLRKALQRASGTKAHSAVALCGCSPAELMQYLQSKFLPGMHWNNRGKWHIDHIIPCSAFDLTDPNQQAACFHYSNLQPLWARDNIRKGAKTASTS